MSAYKTISCLELYNILQDQARTKLVIDLRDQKAFEQDSIRTATHLNFIKDPTVFSELSEKTIECHRLQWEINPVECKLKKTNDWVHRGTLFKIVVLYDEDGQGKSHHIAKLLEEEKKILPENIRVVEGGFSQFIKLYPYVCSSKDKLSRAIDGALPTEIVANFLYLGSYENATDGHTLKTIGITHILNMADELENAFPDKYKYKHCRLNDTSKDSIMPLINSCIHFIEEARTSTCNKILIHCAMGISRSSAMTIAWLMFHYQWSFIQAKDFVRSQRSTIKPNEGFVSQLIQYEHELHNNNINK